MASLSLAMIFSSVGLIHTSCALLLDKEPVYLLNNMIVGYIYRVCQKMFEQMNMAPSGI